MIRYFNKRKKFQYYDRILEFLSTRGVGNSVKFSSVFNYLYDADYKKDIKFLENSKDDLDILYAEDLNKPISVYKDSFSGYSNKLRQTLIFLSEDKFIDFNEPQRTVKLTPKGDTKSFVSDYNSQMIDKYLTWANGFRILLSGTVILVILNWDKIKSILSSFF